MDLEQEFDTEHEGRMYLSVKTAEEIGRFVGLIAPDELEQARADLEVALDQIEALTARVEEAEEFEEAVEHTLKHFDRKIKRKPGPKPKSTPDPEPIAA